jgi:hypothetical protein
MNSVHDIARVRNDTQSGELQGNFFCLNLSHWCVTEDWKR